MRKNKRQNYPKDSGDQVVLEPGKYPNLEANLAAKGLKIPGVGARSIDTRNSIIKDLVKNQGSFMDLLKKNDPTQIPFLTTSVGNMLVNPTTVSLSTLMKIAQNEIVAKCMSMNVTSVLNTTGEIYHEDKVIQKMLRENIYESDGGLRDIIEKVMTFDWAGFSLNYIRDEIDDNGYTKYKQLDLLPPSGILFSATAQGNIENIYQYIYTYPYANTQNLFSFPFSVDGAIYGNECGDGIDPLASYSNVDFVLRTNILNTFGLIALDKSLCMHATCDNIIKVTNPYGYNPLTRRVYDLVMLYDLYKQLHSTFLSYRACPLLVGYADSNKTVDDPTGQNATMSALDALYNSMATMGTNGALILSGLKDQIYHIEAINTEGDTKAFETALTWYANQIEQCMGLFNLNEGSFATATAQTSIYGRIVLDKKDKVTHTIRNGLFKHLIHSNFGTKIKNYGYFENDVPNLDDQLKAVKIMNESAANAGFNPGVLKKDNDYQRTMLGQPILTNEEFEELKSSAEEPDSPMDMSSRTNVKESQAHYKHGENHGV